MEDWKIDAAITGLELPEFEKKLAREVYLLKVQAVLAQKILLASEKLDCEPNEIYLGVGNWMKNLYAEKS